MSFPTPATRQPTSTVLARGLERIESSFVPFALAGYRTLTGSARFSHLHGDLIYIVYIYIVANSAWHDLKTKRSPLDFFS